MFKLDREDHDPSDIPVKIRVGRWTEEATPLTASPNFGEDQVSSVKITKEKLASGEERPWPKEAIIAHTKSLNVLPEWPRTKLLEREDLRVEAIISYANVFEDWENFYEAPIEELDLKPGGETTRVKTVDHKKPPPNKKMPKRGRDSPNCGISNKLPAQAEESTNEEVPPNGGRSDSNTKRKLTEHLPKSVLKRKKRSFDESKGYANSHAPNELKKMKRVHFSGKKPSMKENPLPPITESVVEFNLNLEEGDFDHDTVRCWNRRVKHLRDRQLRKSLKANSGPAKKKKKSKNNSDTLQAEENVRKDKLKLDNNECPYMWPEDCPDPRLLPSSTPPPRNRNEAMRSPYWKHWLAAEKVEVAALNALGTGELADRKDVPKGAKVLKGRWVYDWKKEEGKIIFAKARYTVMGCFQTEGVDFHETFAPVMTHKTLRTVFQIVNLDPTSIMEQWDVKTAFIYSLLEEKVYCDQPIGHEDTSQGPRKIWRLIRSLYGLTQSARNWNLHLRAILKEVGAKPLHADPGTFILKEGSAWCIMPVQVDDCFPAYNVAGKYLRDRIAKALGDSVKVKFQGEISWALKMRVYRDKEKGIIKLSQESFVWEFLTRHGFLSVKPASTPADPKVVLPDPKEVTEDQIREVKDYPFREIVGCYLWLATISRPDIAVATHMAARCQHKPTKILWRWLVHIARYLKATAHWGMVYTRPENLDNTPLFEQFVDVSFAPDLLLNKGKSRIGYLVKFLGAFTTWNTMMSKRTLTSSSEAECNGVIEAWKENVWQKNLQVGMDLFVIEITKIWEDNTAAITLGGAATYHKRSKHFSLEWYAVKEAIENKEIFLEYLATDVMLADFLTKVLSPALFTKFRGEIMGTEEMQRYFGVMVPPIEPME